jgi:hypothetical protein
MICHEVVFSRHAILRMFERGILPKDVRAVLVAGEVIAEYPDDKPYPSRLMVCFIDNRPIHVVVAIDAAAERCEIITTYVPDAEKWGEDFKSRRTP